MVLVGVDDTQTADFMVGKPPLTRIDPTPRVDKCMHLYIVLEVLLLIEDWRNEGTSWLAVFGGQPMDWNIHWSFRKNY